MGLYQPPLAARERDEGVLLCYPGFHEYNLSHWAFRRLAGLLAREGFHVLRFDYFGTGDSAGGGADGSVAQWQRDVVAAAEELREVAGVRRVSAVGVRLGATLAAAAAAAGGLSLADLVLVEPVVRGAQYLAQLRETEREAWLDSRTPRQDSAGALLGYPLPPALEAELEALALTGLGRPAAERLVLVTCQERPEYAEARAWAQGTGVRAEAHHVPDAPLVGLLHVALRWERVLPAVGAVLTGRAGP
jgi:pimeloyl-ACP methyl ester carboxylesterase